MSSSPAKDKSDRLEALLRSLDNALNNAAMYPDGHPMLGTSAKALKGELDGWFRIEGKLDLGFAPNALFLKGVEVKEKRPVHAAVAAYFHERGVLALSLLRGVSEAEIASLLNAAKNSPESIAASGGIAGKLRGCSRLAVKQVDYSAILAGAGRSTVPADPLALWQRLSAMQTELTKPGLGGAKVDSLLDLLKDTRTMAAAIQAAGAKSTGKTGDDAAGEVWRVIGGIHNACRRLTAEKGRTLSKRLAAVVSQLTPQVLARLFDADAKNGTTADLQSEMVEALPDETLTDLILSILGREGKVDQTLLQLFDRLSAKDAKASSVAAMVSRKFSEAMRASGRAMSEIQLAVAEAFAGYPENAFMSKMYKLTMDMLSGAVRQAGSLPPGLVNLVKLYESSRGEAAVRKEKATLILNILWFEESAPQFQKLSKALMDELGGGLSGDNAALARDAVTLYAEKMRAGTPAIALMAGEAMAGIAPLAGASALLAMIPRADNSHLSGIGRALGALGNDGLKALLDACRRETNPEARKKLNLVLQNVDLSDDTTRTFLRALDGKQDAWAARDALGILLRSPTADVLEQVFRRCNGGWRVRPVMLDLVQICGERRIAEAVSHLEMTLTRRPLINWGKRRGLRAAAAESLGRIGSPEALRALAAHRGDRSASLRTACEAALAPFGEVSHEDR